MPAHQDWRTFFQGSPLSLIYKVPLLLIVGLIFAVYSGIQALILRLPLLFRTLLHYADVYYDQILRFLVRSAIQSYEFLLRPIPFYLNHYVLPGMWNILFTLTHSFVHGCQIVYRSVLQPIGQISWNFLSSLVASVAHLSRWFWLNYLQPLFLFIGIYLLPWLLHRILHFFRTIRWSFRQAIHSIDTALRFLLHQIFFPLYRGSRALMVSLVKGIYRWTKIILHYLIKYLFLVFVVLASNVIGAYRAARSLYFQHLLPGFNRFVSLIWFLGGYVRSIVASLAEAFQRSIDFCSHRIVPAIGQALSASSTLMVNWFGEVRTNISEAVQVARQLIDHIYRSIRMG